jgi:hypothetical protein
MVEKKKGVSIKCLRSNAGGKYFSNEFNEYVNHGLSYHKLLSFSSLVFLSINDLNPDKPPNYNY